MNECWHTLNDGFRHASHGLDFLDDFESFVVDLIGERFHHVGAGPGIDDFGDAALLLQDDLRVSCNAGAEYRGKSQRLIKRVGMKRLSAAENSAHRLDRRSNDVIVRVL